MARYSCVVWDWNGTLLDDMEVCISVMNKLLEKRDLPLLDTKRYKEIFGFPVQNYYMELGFNFDQEPFEKISREFISGYKKENLYLKLRKDSIQALDLVRKEGIRQVILSASQLENLQEQVRNLGVIDYFDNLLGLDHIHATSKIDIGKRWIEESGFDKKELLLVGDTLHDYETACGMGCDCILLANGHQSKERLSSLNVPVIESLMEVKSYLLIES